jgi:conjugal transfer mating pair stabilization protein TraG
MYEVYAYWNVVELEAMFNAVASLMGSGDYRGLLQTIAIVGMIVVVIATLTGRERLDGMWKWLFFLAIFQSMLLIPKVTVMIVDRTGNEPPRGRGQRADRSRGVRAHDEQGGGLAYRLVRDGLFLA